MPSGPLAMAMEPSADGGFVRRLIGETASPLATYAVEPFGAIAIAWGALVRSIVDT